MNELTISSLEFKALSSENRIKVLKLLAEKNHTLTEISKKLEISSPSTKQHLGVLMKSELIQLIDEGRKWKYYSLTRKGKKLLSSKETQTQVFILLGISSLAFVALTAMLFYPIISAEQNQAVQAPAETAIAKESSAERDNALQIVQKEQSMDTTLSIAAILFGILTVALGLQYFRLAKK